VRTTATGRVTDMTGKLSLMETAAAMEFCRVVVANDSGLMHMATAVLRPVVALFGSTVREFGFYPYHSSAVVLERDGLHCRPCSHIGRAACPKRHFACLNDISPEQALDALDSFDTPGSVAAPDRSGPQDSFDTPGSSTTADNS
jgi:ADP-heptose:LPS heptosyltransferase